MANIEIFGTLVRNDNNTNRDKIVQGVQVEGGYFVCETLPINGTWQVGQLCYCTGTEEAPDNKYYKYNGEKWEETPFSDLTIYTTNKTFDEKIKEINTTLENYVEKNNTDVQCIRGGLVLGREKTDDISGTGKGRIMATGQTNPLIGVQAVSAEGELKTPYYVQAVAGDDKLYIGPTSTKALTFDTEGNMTSPANLTISGNITEGTKTLSEKYASKEIATSTTDGLMSATDKSKLDNIDLTKIVLTEDSVTLANDLYTYAPVGAAQKATNEVIGSGNVISNTNPGKLGAAGESLKMVFNKIFGEQTDTQPTISTSGVSLSVDPGTTTYGGGEYGTPVSEKTVTITFTLNNSGTASYGYRINDTKYTGSQTFKYAITKQSGAQLKITLPSEKTASSGMVTAGTYISHDNNTLYCDFDSNNKVSIKITLPEDTVSLSQQTRYNSIEASVELGAAQKEDGTTITSFLTFLKNDASNTSSLIGGTKTGTTGKYTISAGSYYNYYVTSTTTALSEPVENATRYSGASVTINCPTASHVWFLLPPGTAGSKSIQYEPFANTWADAFGGSADTTLGPIDVEIKLDSGATAIYKGYYTSAKAAVGSSLNYKIV